ncbi:hypothetical protein WJX73_001724 [Symbiochloris irregularis]|uniref:Uncharacterized protein n=1 Tax=Symbiochloris irregularis TaxID=706552 RepID=A0AAW1NZ12_9CHLO
MEVLEAVKKPEVYTMMVEGKGEPFVPIFAVASVAFGIVTSAFLLGTRPLSSTPNGAWDVPRDALVKCNFGPKKLLFFFRLYCCVHIFVVLASMLWQRGSIMMAFYTNWSWALEGVFFGLAAHQSYSVIFNKSKSRQRKFAANSQIPSHLTRLGYIVIAQFHILLAATIVVDLITWTLLWPMLRRSPNPARVAFFQEQLFSWTSYNTHGLNLVFIYIEFLLNTIPFQPYLMGWMGMYSSAYGLWAFSYYKIFNKWMYPFLDASRPGAVFVYFGLVCRNGRIVAIQLDTTGQIPLQGTLPAAIGNITFLRFLELSGNRISGTLPGSVAALPLQQLNLSFNDITGSLPSSWSNLTTASSVDLSSNNITGNYPLSWVAISNAANLTGNPICTNTLAQTPMGVCSGSQPPVPGMASNGAAAPPPPAPNNANQLQQGFGSFQMSTGINIAVSVVIASALLIALAAGYLRIKRQQQAHRAYLDTRTRVLQLADNDIWQPPPRNSFMGGDGDADDADKMPTMVLNPDGKEILIAAKDEPVFKDVSLHDGEEAGPAGASGTGGTGSDTAPAAAGQEAAQPAPAGPPGRRMGGAAQNNAPPDRGRELTSTWLRQWGQVDRIWAEHVAASLNAELDARRRQRRRPLPLYVVTLAQREDDPSSLDFYVQADEPPSPTLRRAQSMPSPAPPPPRVSKRRQRPCLSGDLRCTVLPSFSLSANICTFVETCKSIAGIASAMLWRLLIAALLLAAQQAIGQSLYGAVTDSGDEAAILAVQKALVASPGGHFLWNWQPGTDPCGLDPLVVEQCRTCAWRGIFCVGPRIVGLVLNTGVPPLLSGTLPAALGNITYLTFLDLSSNRIFGSLPDEMGSLQHLQYLNFSSNILTGGLPDTWSNLASNNIVDLDLSWNNITGRYPPSWGGLTEAANLTGNPVCTNSTTQTPPAACPPPQTSQTGPQNNNNPNNSLPTFGSFDMSTGINIAVSVVIASALLVALGFGYLRIKRQQQAHRAYLATRTRVLQIADDDDWQPPSNAYGGGMLLDESDPAGGHEAEKLPMLVLNPDHREILIASREDSYVQAAGTHARGRELTRQWLRQWARVDRIWAEHVAASLNAELDARRRQRRRPLPLYVVTLAQHEDDPSMVDFHVQADEPPSPTLRGPSAAAAPAPPPPRFAWLGRIGRTRRGETAPGASSSAPARAAERSARSATGNRTPQSRESLPHDSNLTRSHSAQPGAVVVELPQHAQGDARSVPSSPQRGAASTRDASTLV